jgi:hypothetical protein
MGGVDIQGDLEDLILDHISTAWATDENLTQANRVTAQFSIPAGSCCLAPVSTGAPLAVRYSSRGDARSGTPAGRT